jgi:asparagine synthase (glutamine-hydrolysing)
VKGLQKRYLFKRAFRQLLPPATLRKKKHGFGVPVSVWLRTDRTLREMAEDTLLSRRSLERGYFRPAFVERLLQRHQNGTDTFYGDTVWSFLMLELWHRQCADEAARVVA